MGSTTPSLELMQSCKVGKSVPDAVLENPILAR